MILGYKSELKAYYCITESFLTSPSHEKITISYITIKYIRKLGDSPASEQRGEGRIDQSRIGAHANVKTRKAEYTRSISKRVVFWSSGFGKKSGFLPLSELLSFQSLKGKFLIPDSERKRFVEMAVRSPQGETMKFSMQGPMRKYQAKVGSTLKLMYEVVARIEGVNSVHQM